jgi:SAM-dependent methyltransferase
MIAVEKVSKIMDESQQSLDVDSICLHIGCGLHTPDGWENIDASPGVILSKIPIFRKKLLSLDPSLKWSKVVKYGDIVKGLKYPVNSCDLIFAAHVLEHLTRQDFDIALKNIYSYLKPGGIFRFIVPDLKSYVDTYISEYSDNNLSAEATSNFMLGSWLAHLGSRKNFYNRLREAFSNSRHQWMWDEPSLLFTLPKYGFTSVRKCNFGDYSDERFSLVEKEDSYAKAIGIEVIK